MRYFDINEIADLPKYDTKVLAKVKKRKPLTLSDRARDAVEWYRGSGYDAINGKLRGEPLNYEPQSDDEQKTDYGFIISAHEAIGQLDQAMRQAPTRKASITVFRGERDETRRHRLNRLQVGESFSDNAYLSTSFGPSYAFYAFAASQDNCDLSMIEVPSSVRGLYIGDHDGSGNHSELEFLIDRGTRYTLRERRVIPNRNRAHRMKTVNLSVWDATPT